MTKICYLKFIIRLLVILIRVLVVSRVYTVVVLSTGTRSVAQEMHAENLERTSSKLPILKTGKAEVS